MKQNLMNHNHENCGGLVGSLKALHSVVLTTFRFGNSPDGILRRFLTLKLLVIVNSVAIHF